MASVTEPRAIIISGGRDFTDYRAVDLAMERLSEADDIVISGGAFGADELGERYANENNHPLAVYKAKWQKYRAAAGSIRNRKMANNADVLIAFWDGESPGTKNMIEIALGIGIEVHVYFYHNE